MALRFLLRSERENWQWAITWDNPLPADSSTMKKALGKLGRLTEPKTKTTVFLAPRATVSPDDIRRAIRKNLHPTKGNAFYANMKSQMAFEIGPHTKRAWKRVH